MHIVQRSQANLDLFRLRGRLDDSGISQLEFLLRVLPVERTVLFDMRRLANSADPALPSLLAGMMSRAPQGKRIEFAGLPHSSLGSQHCIKGAQKAA
jgi:hypothetical protein